MQLTNEMKRISTQSVEDVKKSVSSTYRRYGFVVTDATEPLQLTVTREHIRRGTPGEPNSCAIAQSAMEAKKITGVSVGVKFAFVGFENGVALRFKISPDIQKMTRAFDAGREVYVDPAGVSITLEAPSPTDKIGARKGEKWGSGNRKGHRYPAIRAVARRQVKTLVPG